MFNYFTLFNSFCERDFSNRDCWLSYTGQIRIKSYQDNESWKCCEEVCEIPAATNKKSLLNWWWLTLHVVINGTSVERLFGMGFFLFVCFVLSDSWSIVCQNGCMFIEFMDHLYKLQNDCSFLSLLPFNIRISIMNIYVGFLLLLSLLLV